MEKLDIFRYSGTEVVIKKGRDFSKNELKSRLNQMGIDISDIKDTKHELEKLYNEAIQDDKNKEKIFDKLKKDSVNNNYLNNNERKKLSLNSEEAKEEHINKKSQIPKKVLIKNEELDENQLTLPDRVDKNLKNSNNSSRNINNNRIYLNNDLPNNKSKLRTFICLILLGFFLYYLIHSIIYNLDDIKLLFDQVMGIIAVSFFGSSMFLMVFTWILMSLLPLIICCLIMYCLGINCCCCCCICNCIGRCKFNSQCKKILEDIKKLLKKQMNKTLSENDIIEYFWVYYCKDENEFITKYLKELIILSNNDNSIKRYKDYNENGIRETFWELMD